MIYHTYMHLARSLFVAIPLGEHSIVLEHVRVQGEQQSSHDKVVASFLSVLTHNSLISIMDEL